MDIEKRQVSSKKYCYNLSNLHSHDISVQFFTELYYHDRFVACGKTQYLKRLGLSL